MSSEYLGWRERAPPKEFDSTRFDRNIIPGGKPFSWMIIVIPLF